MVTMCQILRAGLRSQNGGGYWGRSLGNPLFQRGLRRCCAGSRAVLRCTSVGRRVHRCSRIVRGVCTLMENCTLAPAVPWAAARAHLAVPECRFLLPDAKQHSAFSAQSDSGGWTQRRLVVLVGQESTLLRKAHLTYACDATLEVGVATATRRLAGKTTAVLAGTKTTWPMLLVVRSMESHTLGFVVFGETRLWVCKFCCSSAVLASQTAEDVLVSCCTLSPS